jgi:hypothetical protein
MRKLLLILTFAAIASAQTYTEFYVDNSATGCGGSGCSNMNAGSTTAAPVFAVTGRTWTASTRTLLVASTSGVSVGMFISVFPDSTTGDALYICRISTVNVNTSLVCASSPVFGTAPVDGTSTRSANVGGAWKGPNGTSGFPISAAQGALLDSSNDPERINFKSGTSYAVTAAIAQGTASAQIVLQGYTSTVGDGGMAVIDGGTSGTSYILATFSQANTTLADMIFQNNGSTGSADGVAISTSRFNGSRLVFSGMMGNGLLTSGAGNFLEIEAFGNNLSNTAATGGIKSTNTGTFTRPNSHDNTGSNTSGFIVTAGVFIDPIADSNGLHGLVSSASAAFTVIGGAFFNNLAGAGISSSSGAPVWYISNAVFASNHTYGIDLSSGSAGTSGIVRNCGFGAGSYANLSGTINATGAKPVQTSGLVTFGSNADPWTSPTTGNFSVALSAAQAAGRYQYTQTGSSKSGTAGYPDIGTGGQHQCTGVGGGVYGCPIGR